MKEYKQIKVDKNARFIISINDDFNHVSMKDIDTQNEFRLSPEECYEALVDKFREMATIVNSLEEICIDKEKTISKEKVKEHLKIIK